MEIHEGTEEVLVGPRDFDITPFRISNCNSFRKCCWWVYLLNVLMKQSIDYKSKRVETVITISVGFLVMAAFFSWRSDELTSWPLYISVPVLILGLLAAPIGVYITIFWFKLSSVLGEINSRIILALMYFLVITPYTLVLRLFKRNDVLKKKQYNSLFEERNKLYSKKDLENPW